MSQEQSTATSSGSSSNGPPGNFTAKDVITYRAILWFQQRELLNINHTFDDDEAAKMALNANHDHWTEDDTKALKWKWMSDLDWSHEVKHNIAVPECDHEKPEDIAKRVFEAAGHPAVPARENKSYKWGKMMEEEEKEKKEEEEALKAKGTA